MSFARYITGGCVLVALAAAACDSLSVDVQNFEEEIRSERGRQGKVGTLRALGVRRHAIEVATGIAQPTIAACRRDLSKQTKLESTLEIERRTSSDEAEVLRSWREERLFERSGVDARLAWSATFETIHGNRGEREHVTITVDGTTWVGHDPGPRFHRVDLRPAASLGALYEADFEGLLSLARWRRDGPARWVAGEERLRCSKVAPDSAWRSRFEALEATLIAQRFELDEDARRLVITWRLVDQTTLHLELVERRGAPSEIAPPGPDTVVDVERDLSYKRSVEVFSDWVEEGLVRPAPRPENPSSGETPTDD